MAFCILCAAAPAAGEGAPTPTAAIIQAAYEAEATRNASRHDADLEVVSADCTKAPAGAEFLCWVTVVRRTDPARAPAYDVATLSWNGVEWTLKSGLCKK